MRPDRFASGTCPNFPRWHPRLPRLRSLVVPGPGPGTTGRLVGRAGMQAVPGGEPLCEAAAVATSPTDPTLDPLGDDEITPETKDWTWVLDRRCEDCGLEARSVGRDELGERFFLATEEWVQILRSYPAVEVRPEARVWSPLEYGAHVRDVLVITGERLDLLLTRDDPTFENWDQDETAREGRYREQDPEQVADDLETAGERLVSRIAEIEARAWSRPGRRSNGSTFTVETLLQYVLHDVVHHLWDVTGQQDGASSLQLG